MLTVSNRLCRWVLARTEEVIIITVTVSQEVATESCQSISMFPAVSILSLEAN